MAHTIEPATTGRARCRGCGRTIEKETLRLGERVENPFGDGEVTYWFHLACGASRRPQVFLEASEGSLADPAVANLVARAHLGRDHHRLPRIAGAERAPSGRARCRQCRDTIQKDSPRLVLQIWEDGRFGPMGFLHPRCATAYFEAPPAEILARVEHQSPDLDNQELDRLRAQLA